MYDRLSDVWLKWNLSEILPWIAVLGNSWFFPQKHMKPKNDDYDDIEAFFYC